MHGEGTFTVRAIPQEGTAFEGNAGIARVAFDKTWSGALTGTSQCEMLSSTTESTGAMAYVAMERFVGTLNGRPGTFYFAHVATMQKDDPSSGVMKIVVVKNSGTQELRGLGGELVIHIESGRHSYAFSYSLPVE